MPPPPPPRCTRQHLPHVCSLFCIALLHLWWTAGLRTSTLCSVGVSASQPAQACLRFSVTQCGFVAQTSDESLPPAWACILGAPAGAYEDHQKVPGYNGIGIFDAAHCWVKNVSVAAAAAAAAAVAATLAATAAATAAAAGRDTAAAAAAAAAAATISVNTSRSQEELQRAHAVIL